VYGSKIIFFPVFKKGAPSGYAGNVKARLSNCRWPGFDTG
jgi:hypothetical protein